LFAPKGEKELYKAIQSNDLLTVEEVGQKFPDYQLVANSYVGIMLLNEHRNQDALSLLSSVMNEVQDPAEHPFTKNYIPDLMLHLTLAPRVTADIPFGRAAIGLALAELYRAEGNLTAAFNVVVHQLGPVTPVATLFLARLLIQARQPKEVVDLTNHTKNENDGGALLCVYRGIALRELGYYEASRVAFKEALKSKSRIAPVCYFALSERARTYLVENKKSLARKDLERILAEDASYPSVRQRLAELA
jgi:hypothetical protein